MNHKYAMNANFTYRLFQFILLLHVFLTPAEKSLQVSVQEQKHRSQIAISLKPPKKSNA